MYSNIISNYVYVTFYVIYAEVSVISFILKQYLRTVLVYIYTDILYTVTARDIAPFVVLIYRCYVPS